MLPFDLFQTPDVMEIAALMHHMGLTPKYRGFYSILCSVILIRQEPDRLSAIIKEVYMDVARQEGRTWPTVERNIRYAIRSVWEGNPEAICRFCDLPVTEIPTNKELLERLYLETAHNIQ